MKEVQEIAKSIAFEIESKYGITPRMPSLAYQLDREGIIPSLAYQLDSEGETGTLKTKNFSIAVRPDVVILAIASPDAKGYYGEVGGLPGFVLDVQIDPHAVIHRFELTDPNSLEDLFSKIGELTPPKI
jgi:hypothetical protein